MWPPVDSWGLYAAPTHGNAISWSEDNLLAVASGAAAIICNPADLGGAKAVTAVRKGDFKHLQVKGPGEVVKDELSNMHIQTLTNRSANFNEKLQGNASIRDLAWSPVGQSSSGGCILATVTDDCRVQLFEGPGDNAREWELKVDLTDALFQSLTECNWQVSCNDTRNGNHEVLRLRGGAPQGQKLEGKAGQKRKAPASVPAQTKRLKKDPKLTATAEKASEEAALDSNKQATKDEGFTQAGQHGEVRGSTDGFDGGKTKVNAPGAEGIVGTTKNNEGSNDGIAGQLAHAKSPRPQGKPKGSVKRKAATLEGEAEPPKGSPVENGGRGSGGRGSGDKASRGRGRPPKVRLETTAEEPNKEPAPAPAPGDSPAGNGGSVKGLKKRGRPPKVRLEAVEGEPAKAKDPTPALAGNAAEKSSKSPKGRGRPQKVSVETVAKGQTAPVNGQAKKGRKSLKGRVQPPTPQSRLEDEQAEQEEENIPLSALAEGLASSRGRGSSGRGSRGRGRPARGRGNSAAVGLVKDEGGEKAVGQAEARSSRGRGSRGGAGTPRGRSGGRGRGRKPQQVYKEGDAEESDSEESGPTDSGDDDFNVDIDEDSSDEALGEVTIEDKDFIAAGTAKQPREKRRRRKTAPRDTSPPTPAPQGQDPEAKAVKFILEEYKVPEDFDPSVLVSVESEPREAFMRGFPNAFLERWLVLRCEVPESEIPEYKKGSHMQDRDLMNYEQVRAEMVHVHGETLQKHNLDQKWLNKECKRVIRVTAINPVATSGSPKADGSPAAGNASSEPKLDATRSALAALQQKRLGIKEPKKSSAEPEFEIGVGPEKRKSILVMNSRRRSRAVKLKQEQEEREGIMVSGEDYESRLMMMSTTCCSWSPMFPNQLASNSSPQKGGKGPEGSSTKRQQASAAQNQSCVLAVGTKSGRIWLWQICSSVDGKSLSTPLIGSIQLSMGWTTRLNWLGTVLDRRMMLAVGGSNGALNLVSINLLDLSAKEAVLGNASSLVSHRVQKLRQPDQIGITALDIGTSGGQTCIAAGKQNGGIFVVRSRANTGDESSQPEESTLGVVTLPRAHGYLPVTAVRVIIDRRRPGGSVEIRSTGSDGLLKLWQCSQKKMSLLNSVDPSEEDGVRGRSASCLGVASSANNLICAVLRDAGNNNPDMAQDSRTGMMLDSGRQSMIFKRLIKGKVHLLPSVAYPTAQAWSAEVTHALDAIMDLPDLSVAHVWDVAAIIQKFVGLEEPRRISPEGDNEPGEEADDEAPNPSEPPKPQAGSGTPAASADGEPAEGNTAEQDPPACTSQLLQRVLKDLTAPCTIACAGNRSLQKLHPKDVRKLQVANIMRRLLHPHRLSAVEWLYSQGKHQRSELSKQWDSEIQAVELILLQKHFVTALDLKVSQPSARLLSLVKQWADCNKGGLLEDLKHCVRNVSASKVQQECLGLPVKISRDSSPLDSALHRVVHLDDVRVLKIERCPASLEVIEKMDDVIMCPVCKRLYQGARCLGETKARSQRCVFCGVRVAPIPRSGHVLESWQL